MDGKDRKKYVKFSVETASEKTSPEILIRKGGQNQNEYIRGIETDYDQKFGWPPELKGICKTLCIEWLKFIMVNNCPMEKMYHFSEINSSVDLYGSLEKTWDALGRMITMQSFYAKDWEAVQKPDKKDLSFSLKSYDKKVPDRTIKDVEEALIKECSGGMMKLKSFTKIDQGNFIKFFDNYLSKVFELRSSRYFILGLCWEKDAHAIAGVVNSDDIVVYEPNKGVYILPKSGGMEELLCQMSSRRESVEYYIFSEIEGPGYDCGCGCCVLI